MLQIICTLLVFMILIVPISNYIYHIATKQKSFIDPLCNRIDVGIFKILRIQTNNMSWKRYATTMLLVNACMILIGYLLLRIQASLCLNPNQLHDMEQTLSFNTIISFMTNTNLQHYAGESSLTYFSQMAVIIMMMFTSAASGYSACMAMIRGILGKDMGNFYEDCTRIITRFFIPMALLVGLFLVSQGVPQNFAPNYTVTTIEGTLQDIASGPIAALESIKHLGTNGGGFFGANSASPLENPTILSNLAELFSMMILPSACVFIFGRMAYDKIQEKKQSQKKKHIWIGSEGRTILIAMSIMFLLVLSMCVYFESQGNFAVKANGIVQTTGNMEGKEMRFGIDQSALFTTVTTSFTTGSVNNAHDTLTPLGGFVPMLQMMLNVVFGGAGVGLMNMLIYVMIAVFLCGLMIGRTPEYLGRKIEGKEMKLAVLSIILHPLLILGLSAIAVSTQVGIAAISNPSYHGLSQVLYEFSSAAANNGSGFEGLFDNTYFWNISTAVAMFLGRYIPIILQLAIAASLYQKTRVTQTNGTLKTNTICFAIVLVFVVYIFAALTFLPSLALGPIAEALSIGI